MSLLEKMRGNREGWYKVSDLRPGLEIAVPGDGPQTQPQHLHWDEIVSITPVGREQVYDIEVEGTHNFVGNDIFAHNTYLLRADPTTNVVSMGGPVGVGTTTPAAALFVQGMSGIADLFDVASSSGASVFSITSTGLVGIGTSTPNHTLTVAGDIGAIAFVNTSTRDAKTDISYVTASTTDDMLGQLVNLKVATYRYKIEPQQDPLRLGFIAEDAQTIAPEILSPDGKGVDLYKLATFNLAATQALAAKVDAHETRITSLEARVAKLESGAVSAATGSPITLSTTSLASALNSFGVLIQKGIAQFNTLVFRQLVASKDADGTSSAGSVTILTGNTVAQVNNSLVLPSTKVFITFNSQITGSWWVSDKAAGSFRVVLSAPQTTDVSFDYFLVQTQGQIATSTPDGTYNGLLGTSTAASGTVTQSGGSATAAITLLGDNPMHISVGGTFVEPGISVASGAPVTTYLNGVQQTVSSTTIDTSAPTTYIITYSTTDASGAMVSATRAVIIGNPDGTISTSGTTTTTTTTATASTTSSDTTPPVVTLNGAAAMQLTVGDTFTDPGATATDNVDGNLTAKIVETGRVDTAAAGSYTLTYSTTDAAGNTGSASRLVTVVAPTASSTTTTTSTTSTTTATSTTP
ncbi:DUF5011 domain-containing protein [Patescibacteria group bacterium]|nr:DUF5011 domain-containing protein [Patescibacteria group bacterium]